MLTALNRGKSLADCVDGWVELPPASGLIALDGPSTLLGGGDHVHVFALTTAFDGRWDELAALRARWYDLAIAQPWSSLALLVRSAYWFLPDDRLLPLLERVSGHWPELDSVGARYTHGLPEGRDL